MNRAFFEGAMKAAKEAQEKAIREAERQQGVINFCAYILEKELFSREEGEKEHANGLVNQETAGQ